MMGSKALTILLALSLLLAIVAAQPVQDEAGGELDSGVLDEYSDVLERLLARTQKRTSLYYLYRRSCIGRSGVCDHRPRDCCYNSSCRCNLWGTNCRCQRMGLFQQWGK
ncbi:unnamed protein product [Meganyctiphanes norvegica]|uniref:U8-agatoxin-Ao1a n=1 Tax=Meganyctiphanes norvegica TaxID=48144 RepID=A0AAV2R0Z5_MEGNR